MCRKLFLTLMPLLAALFMSSCTEDEIFETLGQQVAGPIDITQSSTHFFVLNADIDRKYNAGSILVVDTNGNRVSATETPRLGRFLTLSGTTLIAGFGPTDQYQTQPQIQFYNVSNPANPVLEHTISMDCSPVNAVAPEGYNYFAVSCVGGKIFIGQWGNPVSLTELYLVRQPDGNTRRALHIDTTLNTLYAFTTDWGSPNYRDRILEDEFSFDADYNPIAGANEIPDVWESSEESKEVEASTGTSIQYKFLVYDIAAEAAKGFPDESENKEINATEMRWLYFNANRSNPEIPTNAKYYRSNFWQTVAHPTIPGSFYISQRGDEQEGVSPDANAVYQFTINNPLPVGGVVPATSSFLTATAVYGHEADPAVAALTRFTGNFAFANAGGQEYIAANDFKDKTFSAISTYYEESNFAVGIQTTNGAWKDSISSDDRGNSYFAVGAIGGRVLTGSFFSSKLILLEVSPGSGITTVTTIE